MNWFSLSLLCAFFTATADALCKKTLAKNNEYLIAWVRVGFASPFLLLILPFTGIPALDLWFLLSLLALLPLEILALILYMKAIKTSPLSLTLPFLALTPVFLIFTSYLVLGEKVDKFGIAGIALTTVGAYLLNVNTARHGVWEPFKAIRRERGSMYMIMVAFIYSITSMLGKVAVMHSSPLFFSATYYPVLAAVLFPILLWKNNGEMKRLVTQFPSFSLIGIVMSLAIVAHFFAISLIEVPYVISVKRTSLLFGIMYGALWFHEKNVRERLFGGILMVAGVVINTLF